MVVKGDTYSAVTGIGLVTSLGIGTQLNWQKITAGQSGLDWYFEESLGREIAAGVVQGFDAKQLLGTKLAANTSRTTQLGLVAAKEALQSAGIGIEDSRIDFLYDPMRIMIAVGTSFGGATNLVSETSSVASGKYSPRLVTRSIPSALASQLAIEYHIEGPAMTYAGACAASAQAIGEAHRHLCAGTYDIALVGGADSLFISALVGSLISAGALAKSGGTLASQWCKPFDVNRNGMVLGEAAGFLILERPASAKERKAKVLARLNGYGVGNDAYHETAPLPDGGGAERVMRSALKDAGFDPLDIGYINAHGTGTIAGDLSESLAIGRVFGDSLKKIPVSSIKAATGHTLGAAGAIEAIVSVLAIKEGIIPPTLNSDHALDGAPADIVPNLARPWIPNPILSNSFGFGGQNASLIFTPESN